MAQEYNQHYFSKEEVKKGLPWKFIKQLFELFNESDEHRIDMHIYQEDCEAIVVEWTQQSWKYLREEGGFEYVGGDQQVMQELYLPDNSVVMCYNDADAEETLQEWLNEHPKYKKNSFGRWVEEE